VDKRKVRLPRNWHKTDVGIDAAGRAVGLTPRVGESYRDFASRIARRVHSHEKGTA
jgi:hypothetical protein